MKILVDMNLSPAWIEFLRERVVEAVHWTTVGSPRAPDEELLRYALDHGMVVFTHDLDFGAALALTRATGPSVVQVRAHDVLPGAIGEIVLRALDAHRNAIESGALVTIDQATARPNPADQVTRPVRVMRGEVVLLTLRFDEGA